MGAEQQIDGANQRRKKAQQSDVITGTDAMLEGISDTAPPSRVGTSASQSFEQTQPTKLLVCIDCSAAYAIKKGWQYCPKCSEELDEVEKQ